MARILELHEVKKGGSYILETSDPKERLHLVIIGSIDHFGKTKSEPAHDCYDCMGTYELSYKRGYNYGKTWWLWDDIPSEVERRTCIRVWSKVL